MVSVKFRKRPVKQPKFEIKKAKLKEFPVERGNYVLGNELSPVGVVIPQPDKVLARTAVEAGAAIAGHMVTANIGIEKLVSNIVSNPNIRYLILFGKESEGHLAAESLLKLFERGIDKNGRIIGAKGMTPYIRNLPLKGVERFRSQIIDIIDLLGEEDSDTLKKAVNGCIQEPGNAVEITSKKKKYTVYDPGALEKKPIIIKITDKLKTKGLYETLSPYSTVIHAPTISTAYPLFIEAILSAGKEVVDERGSRTKELLNVQVEIQKPEKQAIPSGYRPEGWLKTDSEVKKYLEKYSETYFRPNLTVVYENHEIKLKQSNVSYTYGNRVTDYRGVNQLEITAKAIKNSVKKGLPSRRFVISLIDPGLDTAERTGKMEIPCFTQFWVYNRKEKDNWFLHGTMFLRSHDAHLAFPANAYAGMKILRHLTKKTGTKIGTLTIFFGSAHIYMDR